LSHHTLFLIVAVSAYAELLRAHFDADDTFTVVGVATDCRSAIEAIDELDLPPDIVVIDANAPLSLQAAHTLQARDARTRVVLIAVEEVPAQAMSCAAAGAAGLVGRTASLKELTDTLHSVECGETQCSSRVAAALLHGLASMAGGDRSADQRARLTAREHEVAELLADGLTNKEMARRMQIELGTVKSHVHSVIRKLGVSRRAQVAGRLRQAGVSPSWSRDSLGV
jgi:DNA-binding NarL/FixJ family response regulator